MRNSILMAGMLLLAASCSNENVNEVINGQAAEVVAPVKVHVMDFVESHEKFSGTRAAQDLADYDKLTAVTLAFYDGNTEAYKHEQVKGALEEGETFGEF